MEEFIYKQDGKNIQKLQFIIFAFCDLMIKVFS